MSAPCAVHPERLAALHDDELAADERAALLAHVEGCAGCQARLEALDALSDLVRAGAPAPPGDVWRTFDADLRAALEDAPQERAAALRLRRAAPALAAAVMLAAAALPLGLAAREPIVRVGARPALPSVTLPYADPPWTLAGAATGPTALARARGLDAAAAALGTAAGPQLRRDGVAQVRVAAPDLEALGPWAPPGVAPLWTADASLLLVLAVQARAALALERDVVAPALADLVDAALRELAGFEAHARDADVRRAARRAGEVLGVAAGLLGRDPRQPPAARARVAAEVAAVRAGRGARRSPVLDRAVDDRALAPRGAWALDPALDGHARAAAWLSHAGLLVDAGRPDDVRAAALLALALAAAPGGEGRSGLGALARLEAALEVLVGPPDGLVPGDLLEALRAVLDARAVRPGDLGPAAVVEALAARARLEAAARERERVGPPGPPVLRLLGGTRSLEGEALTRLVAPALPGRSTAASSLDLLALLGSRRARTVVSARRADGPGYDRALEALAAPTRAWREAAPEVPARGCLEQARLWSAAALLDGSAERAAAAGAPYRDRLLEAALAGLVAAGPSDPGRTAARARAYGAPSGPLVVEPLPRLHARLAFSARRLAVALEEVAAGPEGFVPARAPRVAAAAADLRRVAALEEGLREASLDALAGRAPGAAARAALRDAPGLLAALAPATARAADEVLEVEGPGGAVAVLHRVVWGLDRLALVVPDGAGGLVVGVGPALAAGEVWTGGARLGAADVAARPREDPEWATHHAR